MKTEKQKIINGFKKRIRNKGRHLKRKNRKGLLTFEESIIRGLDLVHEVKGLHRVICSKEKVNYPSGGFIGGASNEAEYVMPKQYINEG